MTADHSHAQLPLNFAELFEDLPVAISVYDSTGLMVAGNAAHFGLWNARREEWAYRFNMVTDPQLAAQGSAEMHRRVMQGETITRPPHTFDGKAASVEDNVKGLIWAEATYVPLRQADGTVTHLIALLRDVTHEVEQSRAITDAQTEIANQRKMIETLSNPVIQIWPGILTLPLVGAIDSRRAMSITEGLLTAIADQQASCVILDITGVPIVDTQVAQHLIQTSRACQLLGCDVALVGISVEIAQTLVQLGIDLSTLKTLANLQAGIMWAFAQHKLRVVSVGR